MALVVCEPCRDCKYTDCVTVCPTDAFFQDERMLYIHPDLCIDCGACVPECPVEAIYYDHQVPTAWAEYVSLNVERTAALAGRSGANVTEKQEPLVGPGCRPAGGAR